MARISGIDLPKKKKRLYRPYTYFWYWYIFITSYPYKAGIDPEMKVSDWTDEHVHKITKIIRMNTKSRVCSV